MATIQIRPERFKSAIDANHFMIVKDENGNSEDTEPWWVATCTCGRSGTDRGHFEDTVQYAMIHVEGAHE
jgi:hypothetical protein